MIQAFDPNKDIINEIKDVVKMLDKALTVGLKESASRVEYHSIELNKVNKGATLTREERKLIYLFLAVYGSALAMINFIVTMPQGSMPVNLFTMMLSVNSTEEIYIPLLGQIIATLNQMIYNIEINDEEHQELRSLLSTAYLHKQYADTKTDN